MVHSLCFMSSLGGCYKLNNKVGLNARNHSLNVCVASI
jgi:hypothetical protein